MLIPTIFIGAVAFYGFLLFAGFHWHRTRPRHDADLGRIVREFARKRHASFHHNGAASK